MAQPKELNFNEIETEQLIDLFEDDDDETSDQDHVDITKFCIDLDNNEVIDDEQFDYFELKNKIELFDNYWRTNEKEM